MRETQEGLRSREEGYWEGRRDSNRGFVRIAWRIDLDV